MKPAGQDLWAHAAPGICDSTAPFALEGQSFLDNLIAGWSPFGASNDRYRGAKFAICRCGVQIPYGAVVVPSKEERHVRFSSCPNCGNEEEGFTILQHTECHGFWCYKSGWVSSEGCGDGMHCPACGGDLHVPVIGSSNFKELGPISSDDK